MKPMFQPLPALAVALLAVASACVVYVPQRPPPGAPPPAGADRPRRPTASRPSPVQPPPVQPPPATEPSPPAPLPPPPAVAALPSGPEALRAAAIAGDVAALESLRLRRTDLHAPLDADGNTALAYAVLAGQARSVEFLLGWGALPNQRCAGTPLAERTGSGAPIALVTLAARTGAVEVLEQLLRYGAMVVPLDSEPPLLSAIERCELASVVKLIKYGAPVQPGWTDKARERACPTTLIRTLEQMDPTNEAFEKAWKALQDGYRQGNNAYASRDFRGCVRKYEEMASLPLFAPGAHRHVAKCYLAMGDEARAAQHLARYLELANTSQFSVEIRKDLLKLRASAALASTPIPPPFMVRWWCDLKNVEECRTQCERGNGGSCLYVGGQIEEAAGMTGRDPRALPYLDRACDLGTPDACYFAAGSRTLGTRGAPKDLALAEKLGRRACMTTSVHPGCSAVAQMIMDRIKALPANAPNRVDQGYDWAIEAMAFVKSGCVMNEEPTACVALGRFHLQGIGLPKNPQRGFDLIADTCGRGDAPACKEAVQVLTDGKWLPRNPDLAEAYRIKGCAAGEKSLCR